MKLKSTGSFLRPNVRAALVYGPDGGQVHEVLDSLTVVVVPDRKDPFRVSELTAAHVLADPAKLAEEAAALSLTGGQRVVRIRDAGDSLAGILGNFLAAPGGETLVLVAAGDLGKASKLRRLFEEAVNAVALPCYLDDAGTLESILHDTLQRFGLKAEPAAVTWLIDRLGGDRLQSRRELEKLALYVHGAAVVTLADAMACVGDSADLTLEHLALAVADGPPAKADRLYARLLLEGTGPVVIVRALIRHFQRLHLASSLMARGHSAEQAMAALKPPPFFKVKERFRKQVLAWPQERLAAALDLLTQTEIDCKSTGMPDQAVCGRTVLQLARRHNGARAGG
ncbi:MAG: DNA polymerase III subunit delta [Rhodospirillaceae bacterium]|nr:MAG: DNA polymerase III subunit delta [Rhodospirillaceae bacterium]